MCSSLTLHLLLLAWLLHAPAPTFVAPSSVQMGERGGSVTPLYLSNRTGNEDSAALTKSSAPRTTAGRQARLTWKKDVQRQEHDEKLLSQLENDERARGSSLSNPAPAAGSPFGSLSVGTITGAEVRPALPIVSLDPDMTASELAGIQGDVVIEITIDDAGNIVEMKVVRSLGTVIDQKVLAALRNWRFRPATRDGAAIASKQDVYYHFPR